MILNKIPNSNIYEFEIKDRIQDDQIHDVYLAFSQFKENGEKINLLGMIEQIPSFDIFQNVSKVIKMKLAAFDVIEKYAIVTDRNLIEELAPIANFFTSNIQIRTFEVSEKDKAIAWLKEKEIKEYDPNDYLTGINIEKTGDLTYEINVDGAKVDHAALAAINSILDELHKGEKINLIIILNEIPSNESFSTLIEGFKIDFKIFGRLDKYAIVSDANYMSTYSKIGDFLTPGINVKSFNMAELEEARNWVKA